MAKIRVFLADDHALFREGLRALLAGCEDIEVVGEAADGQEALARVPAARPDVVLMDIAMPGLGGLEATLALRRTVPAARVLVLTQYESREYLARFLKAGAAGYVLKRAGGAELITAIRAVAAGQAVLHPAMTAEVIEGYLKGARAGPGEAAYEALTERERQVLKLIAEGQTSKEIAQALDLSVKTVITHRTNLMEKLGLHNRAELVKFAVRLGLIQVDTEG
jgi:DNA-binding NarL/FixJ family response regulator